MTIELSQWRTGHWTCERSCYSHCQEGADTPPDWLSPGSSSRAVSHDLSGPSPRPPHWCWGSGRPAWACPHWAPRRWQTWQLLNYWCQPATGKLFPHPICPTQYLLRCQTVLTSRWQVSLSPPQTRTQVRGVSPASRLSALELPPSLWLPIFLDPRRLMSCWCGWREKIRLIRSTGNTVGYLTLDTESFVTSNLASIFKCPTLEREMKSVGCVVRWWDGDICPLTGQWKHLAPSPRNYQINGFQCRSRVGNEINSTFLQAGIDFDLLLGEGGGSVMDVMQFHRNQFSDVSQCVWPSQPIFQAWECRLRTQDTR